MSFFSCSSGHFLQATLSACKDPPPNPQQLQRKNIKHLCRRLKSPVLLDLKTKSDSRLSLKKVKSSKSIRDNSDNSMGYYLCPKIPKENARLANDYGFFDWRVHQNKQKDHKILQKRISITYQSPEAKKVIENYFPTAPVCQNLFSKQSMTTQPSMIEARQSINLPSQALSWPLNNMFKTYFGSGGGEVEKKDRESYSKISCGNESKIVEKKQFKVKKRTTLNTFNPKQIDSEMDGSGSQRDEQFSIVVERHEAINPFEQLNSGLHLGTK